jgi:hypothetical protein
MNMATFNAGDLVTVKAKVDFVREDGALCLSVADATFTVGESDIATHTPMTLEQRLAGLTIEQIAKALSREDTALADALEMAGAKIAKTRRESGEMRRRVVPKETAAVPVPAVEVAGEAHAAQPADDTPAAELSLVCQKAFKIARIGRASFDKHIAALHVDEREEINGFMPELLGVADAADPTDDPESDSYIPF